MKIGIAGIGKMGAAMAERLLALGDHVVVWNRSPGRTGALEQAGATVASSPAALAAGCEVVLTILTDAAAVDAVYGGPQGLLAGAPRGRLFIEMSTVPPETQRALSGRVRAAGCALVECPVGGTTGPARDGKLFGFAGGEDADVARARPVLEKLCRRIEHVGPVGAGASMKLAINLPLMVYWQAFSEALALCRPLGIAPSRLLDIFADTSGGPNVLKTRGPAIARALAGEDIGPTTFDIDSMRKDLLTMVGEAAALGHDAPVTRAALNCFEEAIADGLGKADCSQIMVRWLAQSRG